MLALLEILNDDLNIAGQPSERRERRDSAETAKKSDQVLAEEAWRLHTKWVKSFFTALFAWQHKTTRVCTVCRRQSRSIETVVPTLSLALPATDYHYVNVAFHRLSDRVLNLTVKLPLSATTIQLVQEVASKIDIGHPIIASNMITMELAPSGSCFELPIWKAKDNVAQKVSAMRDERIHVFEAAGYHQVEGTKILAQMVQRRLSREDKLFAAPWKPQLLGYPSLLCTTEGTGKQLYEAVWEHMNQLVGGYSKDEIKEGNYPFVLTRVTIDGMTCSDCGWLRGCIGCKIENDQKAHNVQHRDTIGIDWDPAVLETDYITLQPIDHCTVSECTEDRVSEQQLQLRSCISTYFEKNTLLETPIECKPCKGLTIHSQSVAAWALPPVLVIQLKRFTWSAENGGQKVQTPVEFPITGLDFKEVMSEIVGDDDNLLKYAPQLSRSDTIYDLTAVVNHEGARTTWGHYDCFVRESGRWLHLNDSQLLPLQESDIQTSKAYLLFYTRRNLDATPLSSLWPESQHDPSYEARAEDLRRELRKAEVSQNNNGMNGTKKSGNKSSVKKNPNSAGVKFASKDANSQCACCVS